MSAFPAVFEQLTPRSITKQFKRRLEYRGAGVKSSLENSPIILVESIIVFLLIFVSFCGSLSKLKSRTVTTDQNGCRQANRRSSLWIRSVSKTSLTQLDNLGINEGSLKDSNDSIGSFYAFILSRNPNVRLSVVARSNYEAVKDKVRCCILHVPLQSPFARHLWSIKSPI